MKPTLCHLLELEKPNQMTSHAFWLNNDTPQGKHFGSLTTAEVLSLWSVVVQPECMRCHLVWVFQLQQMTKCGFHSYSVLVCFRGLRMQANQFNCHLNESKTVQTYTAHCMSGRSVYTYPAQDHLNLTALWLQGTTKSNLQYFGWTKCLHNIFLVFGLKAKNDAK